MGIVYCLTSPNGKKYIGQTRRTLEKRIKEHCNRKECTALYNALLKYGIDNFKVDILIICDEENLNYYEIKYIKEFNTLYPNGYNIKTGGINGKHCEKSKEKMRIAKTGDKNPNYGKPRCDNTKMLISERKKGENHHFYGKSLSYEHLLNLSKSHKNYNLPMYVIRIKERPQCYQSSGYAILNHPQLKSKYFTSKKYTDSQKLEMALEYLNNKI